MYKVFYLTMIVPFVFLFSSVSAQHALKKEPIVVGESLEFYSHILGEHRTLNIYLPQGYHKDSIDRYPVIYLLDGSMDEDFVHIAGIVQFGTFSWINMLPRSIVVGIANVDRKRDFTYPSSFHLDQKEFPSSGKSERFIKFIQDELQPLIDSNYNTQEQRTIIGQSLGGLLASEILLKQPDLFDHYIIVSPSLWWDSEKLLNWQTKEFKKKKSVYIAVGKEGAVMERVAKSLHDKLEKLDHDKLNVYFKYLEAQSHGDALHLAVYDAFEKIFRKQTTK